MPRRQFRPDSLAMGISVMLCLTVVQRAVGFGRGLWFCRLLDDATLGQWAMGFGVLSLVTPMVLLGLPGSLPRYVDVYRQRGQLGAFLTQILAATAAVVLLSLVVLFSLSGAVAGWVFNAPDAKTLVLGLGGAALGVITFNVTGEILAGLRLVRVHSLAQFCQSIAFTILGIAWLASGGGLAGLLWSFALACVLGCLPAWWSLWRSWESASAHPPSADQSLPLGNNSAAGPVPHPTEPLHTAAMWRRLLPYAAAIWVMNLLGNTFELADRYMLLHLAPGGSAAGQQSVGQYHSAMIIPTLMISVANMLAGVLLPYLTADWEGGALERVRERLSQVTSSMTLAFCSGAAAALILAPWLYRTLLHGQYQAGLSMLPLCLSFCIWFAVGVVAQTYLFVTERGRWVGVVLAVGLAANLVCNATLVPRYGLTGAVWATWLANLVVWLGIMLANHLGGQKCSATTLWMLLLPATLLAGPWATLACTVAVAVSSPEVRRYLINLRTLAGCQFAALAR